MRGLALLLALLLAAACRPTAEDGTPRVVEGTIRAADGIPIAYDVRGEGETTLLFVHCWACDRRFWREQLDAFADHYRVVAVDLPGHGSSGRERETWSIAGLGGDVETVVDELGLERVILVGHSMGGPVSLEAARRMPEQVVGVLCVDTLHDAEFEWPEEAVEEIAGRFEADFPGTMDEMVRGMFPEEADPAVVDWVIARGVSVDQTAAVALMRDFLNLDLKDSFSAVGVPVRCVNAAPRPPGGFETAIETNRKYADFDAVLLDGVGHYLMLERPAEFNSRMREMLEGMTRAEE